MTVRSSRGVSALAAYFFLLGATACASGGARLDLPPVTPEATGVHHPGQFVWHDLVTDDVDGAKAFYGALFGWRFDDVRSEAGLYSVVRRNGRAIGGIVAIDDADANVASARWLSLMSVDDIDAAVRIVEGAGGEVLAGPRDNPTRGRMVLVADPQGAQVVLVRSVGGDPPNREEGDIGAGDWLWVELWARDAAAAADFYGSLVGYAAERPAVEMPAEYRVFQRDGRPRAGVNELPWEEVLPNWLSYIRVDDPAAVAAQAERLGGTVLIPPDPENRDGSVALLMDPAGAAFAVQKWPVEGATPGGAR
jgi:predicted enzyme related to lactoylglutathione lyase